MALQIKDAVKHNLKARIALLAPTGGGKTYTMLKFLFSFVKLGMAKKVGIVDTEHGAASKYVGEFPGFRVIELADDFGPEVYIEALQLLADDGCDAAGVDSLTHAWAGKGGSLELKDKFGRQKGFNDYTAWGPVTAMQNRLIEAMLSYPGHLTTTMRLKMEHVIEKDPITGKNIVRKIGLQPVQRDGLEYEFDLVGDLDQEHNFSVSKTRCSALDGYSVNKPGEEVIRKMKAWLESGEAAASRAKPIPTSAAPTVASKSAEPPVTSAEIVNAPATSSTKEDVRSTSNETTHTPAESFAKQMREADSLAKLDGVVAPIGAAKTAGHISDVERKELIAIYVECKAKLQQASAA